MSAVPKRGIKYYVKLRSGLRKNAELKEKTDKFLNESAERLRKSAGKPLDLARIFHD